MPEVNFLNVDDVSNYVGDLIRDRIEITRLQQEIKELKAQAYDRLAAAVIGLRRAIETQERVVEDMQTQLEQRDRQIEKLREEYAQLTSKGDSNSAEARQAERLAWFKKLQPMLTQLPTIRSAVESEGADVSARDVLNVVALLDQVLADMAFEPIGAAGEFVEFDPTRHKPVGRGARDIEPNESVRVRYIGFMYQGEILTKAEVTKIEQPEQA